MLPSGDRLRSGQSIAAPGGDFWLACQKDGNLVLYRKGQPLWSAGTGGRAVRSCVMQNDGNLVLYGYSDEVVWASNTQGNPGAYLAVQDDGNVVIYVPEYPIWSTGTNR
ncbi:MAG: lectin [Deltaproteobacteria bacterium]|nr:lectin [Deltaproteobacteria bacterium]